MKELMIDIETLGTNIRCPVLEIGAVVFTDTDIIAKNTFRLDLQQQFDRGRRPDWSTLNWWMGQDPRIREMVFGGYRDHCAKALSQFLAFHAQHSPGLIWCKGLSFDLPIIESLLADFDLREPWKFYKTRDLRTISALLGREGQSKAPDAHSAEADCIHQIKLLNVARKQYGLPVA